MKNEKEQQLKEKQEAIQLLIQLRSSFNNNDIDECVDALDAAHDTIIILEDCMTKREFDGLPARHDIGIACFWLCELSAHTFSQDERLKNYNMVIEILQPSLGISWVEMYSRIIALRDAVNRQQSKEASKLIIPSAPLEDDLF